MSATKVSLVLAFTFAAAFLAGCPDNSKPGTTPAGSGSATSTASAPAASASAKAGGGW